MLTKTDVPNIQVKGVGIILVEPDVSTISCSVKMARATASEAKKEQQQVYKRLVESLVNRGITADNIKSSEFSLNPNIVGYGEKLRQEGFVVKSTINIEIKDLSKIAQIFDACLEAGATDIGGPNLSVKNIENYGKKLRELAFDDARSKAYVYCDAMSKRLGKVLEIIEIDQNSGSGGKFAFFEDDTAILGKVPIKVSINVCFAIDNLVGEL